MESINNKELLSIINKLKIIKRYEVYPIRSFNNPEVESEENIDGAWVDAEDIDSLIKELEQKNK